MKPKMTIRMLRCAKCGGWHSDFWRSTPPPSCAERQARLVGPNSPAWASKFADLDASEA